MINPFTFVSNRANSGRNFCVPVRPPSPVRSRHGRPPNRVCHTDRVPSTRTSITSPAMKRITCRPNLIRSPTTAMPWAPRCLMSSSSMRLANTVCAARRIAWPTTRPGTLVGTHPTRNLKAHASMPPQSWSSASNHARTMNHVRHDNGATSHWVAGP